MLLPETSLDQQSQCVVSTAVVVAAMLIFMAVAIWIRRRGRRRQALELAQELGFTLLTQPDPEFAGRVRRAYPPSANARVSNLAVRRENELTIHLFDVAISSSSPQGGQSGAEQGVIALVSPRLSLPPFLLVSRPTALEKIGLVSNMVDLVLKQLGLAFGFRQVSYAIDSEFDHRYFLFTNNEEAVRTFFTDTFVSLLAATDGYFVRALGDMLLFSSFNLARVKNNSVPEQVSERIDQARQLYGWILDNR